MTTTSMEHSREIARRAVLFRVYREAEDMHDCSMPPSAMSTPFRPEWTEAMTAMDKVLPPAQDLSIGDLHRTGAPRGQELLDAVMASVA